MLNAVPLATPSIRHRRLCHVHKVLAADRSEQLRMKWRKRHIIGAQYPRNDRYLRPRVPYRVGVCVLYNNGRGEITARCLLYTETSPSTDDDNNNNNNTNCDKNFKDRRRNGTRGAAFSQKAFRDVLRPATSAGESIVDISTQNLTENAPSTLSLLSLAYSAITRSVHRLPTPATVFLWPHFLS